MQDRGGIFRQENTFKNSNNGRRYWHKTNMYNMDNCRFVDVVNGGNNKDGDVKYKEKVSKGMDGKRVFKEKISNDRDGQHV
ncbi:hypothetical protein Tco_0616343, partial [Tanacetum coccineum]